MESKPRATLDTSRLLCTTRVKNQRPTHAYWQGHASTKNRECALAATAMPLILYTLRWRSSLHLHSRHTDPMSKVDYFPK